MLFSTKDKFFLRFHYDDNDAFNLLFVLYNNNSTKVIITEGLTELNVFKRKKIKRNKYPVYTSKLGKPRKIFIIKVLV